MTEVGTLVGQEIKTNRDGDRQVRILKVQITDDQDIQSSEKMSMPGEDSNPPDDSQVMILSLGDAWKLAIAINDGITPASDLEKGEKEFYSSESGVRKAVLRLVKDGIIKMNGGGRQVARKNDPSLVDGSTDAAFITWIATVSTFINGLAPGTIPIIPTTVTGKVNDGSSDVEVS